MYQSQHLKDESTTALNGKKLLSIKEVTQLLGLGRATIYKYIREGKLRAALVGGKYITTTEAIFTFVENEMLTTDRKREPNTWYNEETVTKVQDRFQARKGAAMSNSAERNQR